MPFERVGPEDFKRKQENGELSDSLIIDVRELYEWEYYHWEEPVLMPMNTIPERLEELPKDKTIYVVCAHGVRSANVSYYLKQQGFEHVVNVDGGMAALAELSGFQYD
ncbi:MULTISPECIES: rhodanese-like domain-containing protein [unclassified Paenibacillus]|uniref:rhodanese-like domain-containing protein n=1 Tax=unclassified Paenibacillus TaxID=185978 RepID=UPI001AE935A8|nr:MULTISPECIES: rhodanese-like domain-containing protein [unclassified Paenibacillus]MBP1155224.1 rhodanese-related sulfurtransferase [Paenibacillus sp. PvP091]MBP1169392.1 rhodanese-related sulfurtransferase [Paenibacillus sp. PvR098]MBP2440420.1 rhodanese-related sulfurtransferase [Paenibacillus sp. PvP052]